jgi:Zn-dependent protease with chaperone function
MANCASHGDAGTPPLTPFATQVQRVAGLLQRGARRLYPDLAENGFDIYVAAGDEPGSVSSTSGRIALNNALAVSRPYDDWLAFVIAREMGHVIARHHEENSSVSIAISVAMNILLPGSGLLKSAVSTIGSEVAVSSKRDEQARQADAIAINLLQAAGFSLHEVALSLTIAPAALDDGTWSQGFRRSSDNLITAARGSKFAGAIDPTATSNTR